MTKPIYVLNGPNLNRLGTREPDIYGSTTLSELEALCRDAAGDWPVIFRQSNAESEIVDWIHEAADEGSALLINPAAFTFYSMAIMDALKLFPGPIIEFHISNVHKREEMYHRSLMSGVVTAVMMGLGARGYAVAVAELKRLVSEEGRGP